jgi:DNA (cytosine-5)-methyltransferase 1
MRVGSLFAGIGGFDLGLERAGMTIAWQSEIDPYASAVLRKHWPNVPNHGDIRNIRAGTVEPVDLLCGGFPCQDISNAGKRAGIDGERSGLWSEYARVIGELRPRYVVVENVAALLGRGLDRVLGDLAALGFDAEWHCIPASAVGAPHRRDRIWIVAHARRDGGERRRVARDMASSPRAGEGEASQRQWIRNAACNCGALMAHTDKPGLAQFDGSCDSCQAGAGIVSRSQLERVHATHRREQWIAEPDVGRVANGVPRRVDRLRCLGNAIVPQVAEVIGRAIMAAQMPTEVADQMSLTP